MHPLYIPTCIRCENATLGVGSRRTKWTSSLPYYTVYSDLTHHRAQAPPSEMTPSLPTQSTLRGPQTDHLEAVSLGHLQRTKWGSRLARGSCRRAQSQLEQSASDEKVTLAPEADYSGGHTTSVHCRLEQGNIVAEVMRARTCVPEK